MHERILSSEKFIFEKAEHVNFLNIFPSMILDFLNLWLSAFACNTRLKTVFLSVRHKLGGRKEIEQGLILHYLD